ncbi:hypothetical protein SAQ01S_18040 [Sphingomonas aquatilis NBRC 16722]|uniref:Helix-turn-helix domain-containing protein n=1 Tax=Sphingomonas aquatilis TaxID=93063 RepID=A0AAW3TNR7_9SPHN|nr:hypothetical protein [Sphingomonas aquatilis]MBB3875293.1 hypothetical protein [Sphingomonas aquatilis]GEM72038.1 hypothetical protein SAQ01S_18040 [Sphingomonas aquatilis NBRC 16722]
MTGGVTGLQLHREVTLYVGRTGTSWETLAIAAGVGGSTIRSLNRKGYPATQTVSRLRKVMKANPKGIARHTACQFVGTAPAPTPMTPVVDPASVTLLESRVFPRPVPMRPVDMLAAPTVAEAIASGLVETPSDLIATVQRRWPSVWMRIVERARAAKVMPGALLVEAIERGFEAA